MNKNNNAVLTTASNTKDASFMIADLLTSLRCKLMIVAIAITITFAGLNPGGLKAQDYCPAEYPNHASGTISLYPGCALYYHICYGYDQFGTLELVILELARLTPPPPHPPCFDSLDLLVHYEIFARMAVEHLVNTYILIQIPPCENNLSAVVRYGIPACVTDKYIQTVCFLDNSVQIEDDRWGRFGEPVANAPFKSATDESNIDLVEEATEGLKISTIRTYNNIQVVSFCQETAPDDYCWQVRTYCWIDNEEKRIIDEQPIGSVYGTENCLSTRKVHQYLGGYLGDPILIWVNCHYICNQGE